MKDYKLYETAKENGARLTLIDGNERTGKKSSLLSCIININTDEKKQEVYGFGGALTESVGYVLSKLPSDKREEVLENFFKTQGYTLARTHINSCDFSLGNWSVSEYPGLYDTSRSDRYLLPLLKCANKKTEGKLNVMVSPWSPPAYMKTNGEMNNGGKLKKEWAKAWAEIYASYLQHLKNNGINIWAISVQNEPEAAQIWDSCLYTAEEETEFVDNYLYDALTDKGFDKVKILVWDHNRDGLYRRLSGSMKNSKGHIAGAAYHWYSGPQYDNVALCRKEFPHLDLIFTEGSVEGGTRHGAWFTGERYGHNLINDLNSGCNAWIDWNIVLNEKGGPNHVGNYCDATALVFPDGSVNYQSSYYYIGHFSRFIKPGARIVSSSIASWMTPATVDGRIGNYMEALSAVNPDGSLVLVVMNRTEDDMCFLLNTSNKTREASGYSLAGGDDERVYRCPPRAIQTYIFEK